MQPITPPDEMVRRSADDAPDPQLRSAKAWFRGAELGRQITET
jgi:hypothetical protein